ncbi:hypothetical protein [Microbacterium sp. NPDC055521]
MDVLEPGAHDLARRGPEQEVAEQFGADLVEPAAVGRDLDHDGTCGDDAFHRIVVRLPCAGKLERVERVGGGLRCGFGFGASGLELEVGVEVGGEGGDAVLGVLSLRAGHRGETVEDGDGLVGGHDGLQQRHLVIQLAHADDLIRSRRAVPLGHRLRHQRRDKLAHVGAGAGGCFGLGELQRCRLVQRPLRLSHRAGAARLDQWPRRTKDLPHVRDADPPGSVRGAQVREVIAQGAGIRECLLDGALRHPPRCGVLRHHRPADRLAVHRSGRDIGIHHLDALSQQRRRPLLEAIDLGAHVEPLVQQLALPSERINRSGGHTRT